MDDYYFLWQLRMGSFIWTTVFGASLFTIARVVMMIWPYSKTAKIAYWGTRAGFALALLGLVEVGLHWVMYLSAGTWAWSLATMLHYTHLYIAAGVTIWICSEIPQFLPEDERYLPWVKYLHLE